MSPHRIQIIDSDPTAALVTQRGLQRLLDNDADVTIAPSPEAAWVACTQSVVELLIIDPTPQSVAITAMIKAVREQYPALPILILTAYDSPLLRRTMRMQGIIHYVAKPVTLHDLSELVRTIFGTLPPAPAPDGANAALLDDHIELSHNH